jgi:hypothetical protein
LFVDSFRFTLEDSITALVGSVLDLMDGLVFTGDSLSIIRDTFVSFKAFTSSLQLVTLLQLSLDGSLLTLLSVMLDLSNTELDGMLDELLSTLAAVTGTRVASDILSTIFVDKFVVDDDILTSEEVAVTSIVAFSSIELLTVTANVETSVTPFSMVAGTSICAVISGLLLLLIQLSLVVSSMVWLVSPLGFNSRSVMTKGYEKSSKNEIYLIFITREKFI